MTELEKLITVADLIREISHEKLEVRPSVGNNVFIHARDDAYVAMEMLLKSNYAKGYFDVTFRGFVRRMGTPMTAADMGQLQAEVQQAHALLLALEIPKFHPTNEDLISFHAYLTEQQAQLREQDYPSLQEMSM